MDSLKENCTILPKYKNLQKHILFQKNKTTTILLNSLESKNTANTRTKQVKLSSTKSFQKCEFAAIFMALNAPLITKSTRRHPVIKKEQTSIIVRLARKYEHIVLIDYLCTSLFQEQYCKIIQKQWTEYSLQADMFINKKWYNIGCTRKFDTDLSLA